MSSNADTTKDMSRGVAGSGIQSQRQLTAKEELEALELAIKGASYSTIGRHLGFEYDWVFFEYRQKNPLFQKNLETAREEAAHYIVDSTLKDSIKAETNAEANCIKARLEVGKFVAGARLRRVYGQHQTVDLNQSHDLSGALLAASRRVLPIPDIETQSLPIVTIPSSSQKTESENDAPGSNSDSDDHPQIQDKSMPGGSEGG